MMLYQAVLLVTCAAATCAPAQVTAPPQLEALDGADIALPPGMPPLELIPPLPDPQGSNAPRTVDDGGIVSYNLLTGEQARVAPRITPDARTHEGFVGTAPGAAGYADRGWLSSGTADALIYPNRTACKVVVRFVGNATDHWFACSGTLIDAETLLVAGPCLYDHANNWGWARDVYVFPGWDGQGTTNPPAAAGVFDHYGYARATSLMVGAEWFDDAQYVGAIGSAQLDRAVGAITGWMNYSASSVAPLIAYTRSYPTVAGCSGGLMRQASLQFDPPPTGFGELSWVRNIPGGCARAFPAMVGCGAARSDAQGLNWTIGAVLNDAENSIYASFTRLTPALDASLDDWVAQSRGLAFDLQPLNVNVAGNFGVAGQPFTSVNYRVVNATNGSAANRTYTCRVYLSTNADVSGSDTLIATTTFTRAFGPMSSALIDVPGLVIPAATTPGMYYLGVILDAATDGLSANNDTDGWDAQLVEIGAAPPDNNACANALVLPFNSPITVSNIGATNDGASLCGGAAATHEDAWYTFTAPYTGRFVIEGLPGGTIANAVVSVHTGCPGTTANNIACDAADTSFEFPSLNVNATEGQVYRVRFAGQNNTNGTMRMQARAAVPLNDTCANAATVNIGLTEGTTRGANADGPACFGETGGDVFYRLLVNCPGTYSVDLSESEAVTDTIVSVYNGCPATGGTLIACDNDSGLGQHAYARFDAPFSQFFLIRVAAPNAAETGQFRLRIRAEYSEGDTDGCDSAVPVQTGEAQPFSTCVASPSAFNTQAGCAFGLNNTVGPDVWFVWTAPAQAVTATASACGANFDTVMVVYERDCPNFPTVVMGCNDNGCGDDAVVRWDAQPGVEYAVRIGGAAADAFLLNARGTGTLLVTTSGACVWNADGCFADYNNDAGIDSDDVIAYFQEWDAGATCADVTSDGGVDADDVIAFFGLWDSAGAGYPGC